MRKKQNKNKSAKKRVVKKPKKLLRPSERGEVIIDNRKKFDSLMNFLIKKGDEFKHHLSGSTPKIVHKGIEYKLMDVKEAGKNGYHLGRMFIRDIDRWIEKNKDIRLENKNYKEQYFNLNSIDACAGQIGVAIDADDCYWRTARLLGYISEDLYIIGRRRKSWKTGRNACVGSLSKTEIINSYKNGLRRNKEKQVIKRPDKYQKIRSHIISHVYEMFGELKSIIGDDFHMFLTDCVFTSYKNKKLVTDFLESKGYRVKSKPVEFMGVDRISKKVFWRDFTSKNKKTGEIGVDKYYMYSTSQTIY